jgi:hypothetical protein
MRFALITLVVFLFAADAQAGIFGRYRGGSCANGSCAAPVAVVAVPVVIAVPVEAEACESAEACAPEAVVVSSHSHGSYALFSRRPVRGLFRGRFLRGGCGLFGCH